MGRLVFVPLLAGVLCLAACGNGEEASQLAERPAGVSGVGVGGSSDVAAESESAEAVQEQAASDSGKGDSQLGDGSESSGASKPPEPITQGTAEGEQGAAPAEESEIPEGILAAVVVLAVLVALVAAGLFGWALGRRRAPVAPTVPGEAPVAANATSVQASAARAPTVPVPTDEGLRALKDELVQAVLTFSKAVDERDAEIKRYKEGYDLAVFKRFLRRFINVDLALLHALKENPDDENLGNMREFLDDAFEECGVSRFEPEEGSLYREAWGVQDHPKAISTDDESADGRIAKVVEPGYQFTGQANGPMLVWGAKVQIHRFAGKKEED